MRIDDVMLKFRTVAHGGELPYRCYVSATFLPEGFIYFTLAAKWGVDLMGGQMLAQSYSSNVILAHAAALNELVRDEGLSIMDSENLCAYVQRRCTVTAIPDLEIPQLGAHVPHMRRVVVMWDGMELALRAGIYVYVPKRGGGRTQFVGTLEQARDRLDQQHRDFTRNVAAMRAMHQDS